MCVQASPGHRDAIQGTDRVTGPHESVLQLEQTHVRIVGQQQCGRAGDMRSGHGCAVIGCISCFARIVRTDVVDGDIVNFDTEEVVIVAVRVPFEPDLHGGILIGLKINRACIVGIFAEVASV